METRMVKVTMHRDGKKMLRRLFRPKSFEVPREYRELDKDKFHVKNIITVMK
jgi:hypothetical protein